jgi:OPA family glycerol-3-phosphate transporter-like MFS transporter
MGLFTYTRVTDNLVPVFSVLYAINMYFQSFGAVAIVKVNSAWFHVRERGVFGGLFGILISAGIFLAYQVGQHIVDYLHTTRTPSGETVTSPPYWVFWIPAALLAVFFVIDWFIVRDRPREAGHADFELGDASSGEDDRPDPVLTILRKVVTHPVVIVIAAIEFCTGVVRQGVMQWYIIYAKEKGFMHSFWVPNNWGLVLFVAGAAGGMVAGWLSDKVFGSRRGPVAALLYAMMVIGTLAMIPSLDGRWIMGIAVLVISFAVIGTHGMLSGTATMDFGGRKNAGTAVGLIDGAVYLGTGLQALSLGYLTEKSWSYWPVFLVPFSLIGFVLSMKIRKAMPKGRRPAH